MILANNEHIVSINRTLEIVTIQVHNNTENIRINSDRINDNKKKIKVNSKRITQEIQDRINAMKHWHPKEGPEECDEGGISAVLCYIRKIFSFIINIPHEIATIWLSLIHI